MPDNNGKIGKSRFLNETMEDSKFQITIQMELGKIWKQVDENEEDLKKLRSDLLEEERGLSELKIKTEHIKKAIALINDDIKNCALTTHQTALNDNSKKIEVLQTKVDFMSKVGYALITGFVGLLIKVIWELVK